MALSIGVPSTFMAMRAPDANSSGMARQGYYTSHHNLAQAIPSCKKAINERFNSRLLSSTVDDLSNRFDDKRNAHMIFADVLVKRQQTMLNYYVVCTVSASDNRLRNFEIIRLSKEAKFQL